MEKYSTFFNTVVSTQFTNGKDDVILQQLDSMGNELYSTRFGDETYGSQTFNTLTFDERNIVFDAGQFLIKCDSLFQIQWVNSMAQANGYALSYPLEAIIKSNNDTGFIGFCLCGNLIVRIFAFLKPIVWGIQIVLT